VTFPGDCLVGRISGGQRHQCQIKRETASFVAKRERDVGRHAFAATEVEIETGFASDADVGRVYVGITLEQGSAERINPIRAIDGGLTVFREALGGCTEAARQAALCSCASPPTTGMTRLLVSRGRSAPTEMGCECWGRPLGVPSELESLA
jgi:hypothetical protein